MFGLEPKGLLLFIRLGHDIPPFSKKLSGPRLSMQGPTNQLINYRAFRRAGLKRKHDRRTCLHDRRT
jgi:hypothetical protein